MVAAAVYLLGELEEVKGWDTECGMVLTYAWQLPDVSVKALTKLRAELGEYAKSGRAEPVSTSRVTLMGETIVRVQLKLKGHVSEQTAKRVNAAVKRAIDDSTKKGR